MPDFSYDVLQSFMAAFRSAVSWLGDCISGVFDVVKSSPLYYMPLLLICIIGIVGGIALLIFDVSDRAYMQENYSPLKPSEIKGWYHSRPWLSLSISSFKRRVSHDTKTTEQSQKAFSAVSASIKKSSKPIGSNMVLNPTKRQIHQAKLYRAGYTAHTSEYYRNFDRINRNRNPRPMNPARERLISIDYDED